MADFASRLIGETVGEFAWSEPTTRLIGQPLPVPPNSVPPVVTSQSPTPGTTISPSTPLVFDVTDDEGEFAAIYVTARFSDGSEETVHDGTDFTPNYVTSSSKDVIAGGFRFTLTRLNGWPVVATATIRVKAVDSAGNVSA